MKVSIIFYLWFYSVTSLMAQQDSTYQALIAKAGLLHLQGNYKDAVDKYDQAFALQPPDALTAYKAAGVYSLSDSAKKALFYLNTALNEGWTEADYLIADPYFDFLRETEKPKWNALEELAILKEQEYAATLEVPDLRKEINRMTLKDQQLRFKRAQFSNDSVLTVINSKIQQSDDRNLTRAKEIIQHYGWPRRSDIGRDGQNNLWLIVQHADQDVTFQQVALTAMEKLKGTKELNMENYAFLYDRVQCNLNYKQRYGTQVIWTQNGEASGFRPIAKEFKVVMRRKKLGMQSLSLYALSYGFIYNEVNRKQSRLLDANYRVQVQQLIDGSKDAYRQRDFRKVYDYYNRASTYAGGMSNSENLEAAITFAKIAALTREEQYRGIALDFLALLHLRKMLTLRALEKTEFNILQSEQRWIEIYGQLNKRDDENK